MKLHPRHEPVVLGGIAIAEAVTKAVKDYNLTYGELYAILGGQITSWARFQMRDEREEEPEV